MRILANLTPSINLGNYSDLIPSEPSQAFLTEIDTQHADKVQSLTLKLSLIQRIHTNQVLGTQDIVGLRKAFPEQEAFFNTLPVTVIPSKTSHAILITVLYDVVSTETVAHAKSLMNRYQAILPTAIDTLPDGSLQTPTVREFLSVLECLYRRAPAVAQRIPENTLLSLASLSLASITPSTLAITSLTPHTVMVTRLTSAESRATIALKFATAKNLCTLCVSGTFSSLEGLASRIDLLRSATDFLRFAYLIPKWKEALLS